VSYQADWRSALADVTKAGAPVTFSPPAGSVLPTIVGYAMRVRPDQQMTETAKLIEGETVPLFFVRSVFDVLPSLLTYTVAWAGAPYVVKTVAQIAPSGPCIAARILVAR
jgi:hypothetical protein